LLLCAVEFFAAHGRLTMRYLIQLGARYAAAVVISWMTAVALWPWLQIGNPFHQFKIALVHFATIPMTYEFPHWGEHIWTSDLPASYIPGQLLARLPGAFLLLLAMACAYAIAAGFTSDSSFRFVVRADDPYVRLFDEPRLNALATPPS
jgi:hypothetical protein